MQPRCPHCHQTLPDDSIAGKLKLRGGPWRIYDIVRRAGTTGIESADLFDMLYANRPDGGPETGMRSLYVRIWKLNLRLRPVGKEIHADPTSWGPGSYVLRDYKPERK